MKFPRHLLLCLALLACHAPTLPAGDPVAGKKLYVVCSACHGPTGEGSQEVNAPAIAGQEIWYLETQLKNFRAGIRGADSRDTPGSQMAVMSATLRDAKAIADVAAYVNSLPIQTHPATVSGDAARGKNIFATCTACHDTQAQGIKAVNAPNLKLQQDWYLKKQLLNFKAGIRGKHKDDTAGQQMQIMSQVLADEKAMDDVIAYIMTLAR